MHPRTEIVEALQKLGFLSDDEQLAIEGGNSNSDPDYMLDLISDLDLNSLLAGSNPLNQALLRLASSPVTLNPMKEKVAD